MSMRSYLVLLLLGWGVGLADGSSPYTVGPNDAEFGYEDPFVPGLISVTASRERLGDRSRLATLTVVAREKSISVPRELLTVVPDPDLGSLELGFLPTEESVVYLTIGFGTYVEGTDPDYIRYRVNLQTGDTEVDHTSSENLLSR